MIKRGDVVRIKPEWADEGDDKITFVAVDDESKGRVSIMAMLGLPINPVQVVNVEMIQKDEGASPLGAGGKSEPPFAPESVL